MSKEKFCIGIFVEGTHINIVCLADRHGDISLVDAETFKLTASLEAVNAPAQAAIPEPFDTLDSGSDAFQFGDSAESNNFVITDAGNPLSPVDMETLRGILGKYLHKDCSIAISLNDPHVFYAYFDTDWGLKGKALKERIIQETAKSRSGIGSISMTDLIVLPISEKRIMAIIRDSKLAIINMLEAVYPGSSRQIAFVETCELSLFNLVQDNYHFMEQEVSLIVHIGQEYSRLIFVRGRKIMNIASIIGEGLDSVKIVNTIYSRILLEMDNLNLPKVHNIYLSGEADEVGLEVFLNEMLSKEINIEYLALQRLEIFGLDSLLSRHAISTGAAFRGLTGGSDATIDVDLTPYELRESRKKMKLGPVGWTLVALIPIMTLFFTAKIIDEEERGGRLALEVASRQAELEHRELVDLQLQAVKTELAGYEKAIGVLDSLPLHNTKWSGTIQKLSSASTRIRSFWITSVRQVDRWQVALEGIALYRNRIPQFAEALGQADLRKVEAVQIRDKTVYRFEIWFEPVKKQPGRKK